MSRQTYLYSPKFNKKVIYKLPNNKYQEFTNAYAYSTMLRTGNSTSDRAIICNEAAKEWKNIKNKSAVEIDNIIKEYMSTSINPYFIPTIRANCSRPTVEPTHPSQLLIRLILYWKFLRMHQLKREWQMKLKYLKTKLLN